MCVSTRPAVCLGAVLLGCLACTAKSAGGYDEDPELVPRGDLAQPPSDRDLATPPPEDQRGPDRDRACASVRAEATLTKKPVDIIMIVDNSGSMTDEIIAIERNININFADIIGRSGLDYQVILLSHHGITFLDQSICITMPLSGNPTCMPPPLCPIAGMRFRHYNVDIESTDSLRQILATYDKRDICGAASSGWSAWLRPDAFRVFIEITDDETDLPADAFEMQLFAKAGRHFGDAMNRNYVFHTIAGLKENSPATKPWSPMDPIQMAKCTRGGGAESPGVEYQKLSQRTGGLRFPICEHASFDAVFQTVAQGVVAGARVACEFPVPAPPAGQQIDLDTVRVEYAPGGGGPLQTFRKVAGAGACAPGSFYIDANKIVLCPDACQTVQGDSAAKVQVLFDCAIKVN